MTISDTARKFREVIQAVETQGAEFIVMRKSRPVARIVPEARPQTAREVMRDLHGILDDETGAAWLQAMKSHQNKQRKDKTGLLNELRNPWAS